MVDTVAGGRGVAHYSRVLEFGLLLSRLGPLPFVGQACNSEARFAVSGKLLTSLSPAGSRTALVIFRTVQLIKKVGPGHTLSIKDINAVQRSVQQKPPITEEAGMLWACRKYYTLLHCRNQVSIPYTV